MASKSSNWILGWFAAFVGTIGFGSFAVPIKGEAATSVDIDPLVIQSYKSLMCLWVPNSDAALIPLNVDAHDIISIAFFLHLEKFSTFYSFRSLTS